MITNPGELASRFAKSADIIFVHIFQIVKDPFLRDRVTFDAPSIDINSNSCEMWFRIKDGVSKDELPVILEHVTEPSLFRIRSVISSSSMYCLEYKSKFRCYDEWTRIINDIDGPKPENPEQESDPKLKAKGDDE